MEDLSLSSLKKMLGDFSQVHLESWSSHDIEIPFQIKPKDFLAFAEYDLNHVYAHHLGNSLSNIKRAIDCQIDSILFGLGLFDKSKKQKLAFPQKVSLLNSFNIVSPRILKKINQKRNLLEHEYVNPRKEDVRDFLDVANLFIAYTDKFLFGAMYETEPFNDQTRDSFMINLDYKKKRIIISLQVWDEQGKPVFDKKGNPKRRKKIVKADANEYSDYLQLFLSLYELKF